MKVGIFNRQEAPNYRTVVTFITMTLLDGCRFKLEWRSLDAMELEVPDELSLIYFDLCHIDKEAETLFLKRYKPRFMGTK